LRGGRDSNSPTTAIPAENTGVGGGPDELDPGLTEAISANLGPRAIENVRVRLPEEGAGQGGEVAVGASPRGSLVGALSAAIAAATSAGDLHAARVAHEALGRLLAEPEPGARAVADLASERAKRGGKG
jgi:hypothetical protein